MSLTTTLTAQIQIAQNDFNFAIPEKAFTAFTSQSVEVIPSRFVVANSTDLPGVIIIIIKGWRSMKKTSSGGKPVITG